MKTRIDLNQILLCGVLLLTACSPSRFLKHGDEALYRGHELEFSGPEIPVRTKPLATAIGDAIQPVPNSKFLGLFYTRVWLHEKVRPNPDRDKGFRYWLKYRVGEAPVLIEDVDSEIMADVVAKLAQDHGLLHAEVEAEAVLRRQQGIMRYTIGHHGLSHVAELRLPQGSHAVDSLIRNYDRFKIEEGRPYHVADFREDREQLARHIRSQGFYDFHEKDLVYLLDTSTAFPDLVVDVRMRDPGQASSYRIRYIRDVRFHIADARAYRADSALAGPPRTFKGLKIYQRRHYVDPRALYRINLVEPGRPFSISDHDATAGRLSGTGIFRYVNMDHDTVGRDSLDVVIGLTPTRYQGVKLEVEASTSNRSFLGSMVSASYNNSNLFRGAEFFSIKASSGAEFQFINKKAALNILHLTLETRLELPALIPFGRQGRLRSQVLPKTYFEAVENFQKYLSYYTMNSLHLGAGYEWQARNRAMHRLEPLSFEWITLLERTQAFNDLIAGNPQLALSFSSALITGPNYSFTISSRRHDAQRRYLFFSTTAELAGNMSYLASRLLKPSANGPRELAGVPVAQFVRMDSEVRHYWEINRRSKLVSRIGAGLGVAYGNSEVLPYIRQFFMGGPNTLRAFEFRGVGPGSYAHDNFEKTDPVEQYGDLKLLMNLEYRFKLYRVFRAAFFVDAGNVWLLRGDPGRPGGVFRPATFLGDIALGTGLGLRLDFDFVAIRADLGMPVYKPFNNSGEKWIGQFPETWNTGWGKTNLVWNIAIGYPF